MAEKFDHLEEHLEKFVENIRQLGIIVSDFQPSSQAGLNQKLNFIVTGLQDIDKCRQQLHDITVPLEVFEYIDQGRNPQLYTKECLERALARNEQVKGKIDTMKGALRRLTDMNSVLSSPRPCGELEERSSRLTEKELEEAGTDDPTAPSTVQQLKLRSSLNRSSIRGHVTLSLPQKSDFVLVLLHVFPPKEASVPAGSKGHIISSGTDLPTSV
ncbi:mediator of RNA polymerase II transcription subunit 10 isoform X1 [Panthera onca]|uniref:mediator of RNA polymerase II transcription subunit 10 isoform X2 n=1 Tax=Panthera onca TaxID=9690 RepID=UPI0029551604|nr:mediator of RNA polymerase II transcription subunit 10 isoform X2 [Panthera onca]